MPTSQQRWPLWPWVVLTSAGVLITAIAAIVGAATSEDRGGDQPPLRVTVTATQFQTSTVNVTVTVAPPPDQPGKALLDGIHRVGIEVEAGVYQTLGPSGTNAGGCYWTRTDSGGGVIANGVVDGPGTLTLNNDELVE